MQKLNLCHTFHATQRVLCYNTSVMGLNIAQRNVAALIRDLIRQPGIQIITLLQMKLAWREWGIRDILLRFRLQMTMKWERAWRSGGKNIHPNRRRISGRCMARWGSSGEEFFGASNTGKQKCESWSIIGLFERASSTPHDQLPQSYLILHLINEEASKVRPRDEHSGIRCIRYEHVNKCEGTRVEV